MRRILFPLIVLAAILALFVGVIASSATADDGKGKGEDPKPTEQEPTKGPETPEPTKEPPAPKDSDDDGVIDEEDNCPKTPNPDQANADDDGDGDACDKDDDNDGADDKSEEDHGTNPKDPDSDKDNCGDGAEMSSDELAGGRRNPTNPWDFYDTNGDQSVDLLNDVFEVAGAFGPAGDPKYDPKVDRSPPPDDSKEPDPSKREPWDLGPPDGAVDLLGDIFGSANQFGHSCEDEPK